MRTCLLCPDGVGIRNFVLSPFLSLARKLGPTLVLHAMPEEFVERWCGRATGEDAWERMIDYPETALSSTLRYALAYAQMYWADTQAMRFNRCRAVRGSWRTRAMHRGAKLVGRLAASPAGIRRLDRVHSAVVGRFPQVEQYRRLFEQFKPTVLLCSHQRPPGILPPVLAARSLGIPTATFIFSWDNLTSKGRIAAPFDHFLVWSEHMRGELLRYYPDVEASRTHVVGTPQFDPYAQSMLLWSREAFLSRIGADPTRPLICYSGGDTGTCPEDPQYVRVLMELVRTGTIDGDPQVLVRPAPVDDCTRYDAVRREYPELIFARPAWAKPSGGDWSQATPRPEDIQFLANLTAHADLNINMASTMTLDFAIHDRPVVNVAFDNADPPIFGRPLWSYYYQFEHYRPVIELGAVRAARSPDELATHVNAYLRD